MSTPPTDQQTAVSPLATRHPYLLPAAAIFLGLLTAALLCEAFLRVAGYAPQYFNPLGAFHEPHPLVGYLGRPGFVGRFHKPDFDVVIAQNELGFRRQEYQRPISESRSRIFVFGDSFTWGWGVGQGEVFTDRMSRLMPGVRVENYGLDASGTVQQFRLFQTYAQSRLRSTDTVLLAFFQNDFSDNLHGRLRAEVHDGTVRLVGPPRKLHASWADAIEGASYLVNLVVFSANRLKGALKRKFSQHRARALARLGNSTPEVAVTRYVLSQFQESCRRAGARFVVVYIPGQSELDERPIADPARLDRDHAFRKAFYAIAASLHLTTIDLLPAFLEARGSHPGTRITYLHDAHWTPEGHAIAARVIARFLTAQAP